MADIMKVLNEQKQSEKEKRREQTFFEYVKSKVQQNNQRNQEETLEK